MTADRIKEIQETTAFPNSVSVCQALIKVWNECEHEQNSRMYSEEEMLQALNIGFTSTDETWDECVEFAKEQFKKK